MRSECIDAYSPSCLKTLKLSVYHGEAEKFCHVCGGKTKMDNYREKSLSLFFNIFESHVDVMI